MTKTLIFETSDIEFCFKIANKRILCATLIAFYIEHFLDPKSIILGLSEHFFTISTWQHCLSLLFLRTRWPAWPNHLGGFVQAELTLRSDAMDGDRAYQGGLFRLRPTNYFKMN